MNNLSPFRKLLITVGNLPTAYLESMSYYEGLTYLVNYIVNNIDPNVQQNTEAIKELQEYVTHYFDNLDVQEEINNKLDEMAEDGSLAEVINVQMIGSLENLETTVKTNIVSAINENVEKIGNLTELDTEEKNNLVASINEVLDRLKLFNLTNFQTYSYNQITMTNVTSGSFTLHVATNDDGSLCKIYGDGYLNLEDNEENTTLEIQTSLRPNSEFWIDSGVIVTGDDIGASAGINVRTDGTVRILIYRGNNSLIYVNIPPCLYFVKDFGDNPS